MKGLQRITDLTEPPVIGQRYLVPTVLYVWGPGQRRAERRWGADSVPRPWPVLGAKHNDSELLGFPYDHYHVDPRFLSEADWKRVQRYGQSRHGGSTTIIEGVPLAHTPTYAADDNGNFGPVLTPHPPVEWLALTCRRPMHKPLRVPELAAKLEPHYAGQKCKHGKAGFICPHRGFALGTIEAVDGVITCPLHGLRIDAESGVVLGQPLAPTP